MATEPQLPIDDVLLVRFLAREASPAEVEQVRRWLTDPVNQREFDKLSRVWTLAGTLQKPVDTDAAWQRVRTQMHRPASPVTGPVVRPMPVADKRINWFTYKQLAAVLILAVLTGVTIWQWTRPGTGQPAVALLSATTTTTTQRLILPDGSRVLLNRNSRLTYPARFADSSRTVVLRGEAFFEVAHDAAHPFSVRAGAASVRVLGTSFNVRARGDSVRVAVKTGRVQFSTSRQAVVLIPNQQATYLARMDTLRRIVPLNINQLAYQTGRLSFVNTPLTELVQTLRDVYGTDIRLANPALGKCRLTTEFHNEPIDAVLGVVSESLTLTVRREGSVRVLTGTGCGL